MSRIVTFSPTAKEELIKGVNILADAVSVTLGPKGRNVVIDTYGVPTVTKDGVTVAREIHLIDPIQNLGAQIVKQAASRTAKTAGDGTTTATVLAQALINKGYELTNKYSPIEIKRSYEANLGKVVSYLHSISKPVTMENIKQIATISANNDPMIGNFIYEGFQFVGTQGTIAVEDSKTGDTYVNTISGANYNSGYSSPLFVTSQEKMDVTYEKPLILVTDKKVRFNKELVPAMELAARASKPLVIIADEIEAQALSLLILNKIRSGFPVVAVRAPGFGERRSELLQDVATLTGANLISDIRSSKLEDIQLQDMGTCDKIVVTQDSTLIMNPAGKEEDINSRVEYIKNLLSDSSNLQYTNEKLNERLANLLGKIAVLHVGAATETEIKEKKDRIDDALRATKSAIALGYVPGGGSALTSALSSLPDDELSTCFKLALIEPFNKIVSNAGENPSQVLRDCQESNLGYNALTNSFIDLTEAGIIDPTLVVKEAIINAVSAANMVLLSEATVHSPNPKFDPREGTEVEYQ